MIRSYQGRKVTPKVRDGAVQKKQRHVPTPTLGYVIHRESPARAHRHILTKQDIRQFTSIIPNWETLSEGIESIILTRSSPYHDGAYEFFHIEKTGSIQIPAWEGDLWKVLTSSYFEEHISLFAQLGVASEPDGKDVQCRFTLSQARAFLLLHIFLHELGHHVDRMQSKWQNTMRRGEPFAEQYANDLCAVIWPEYLRVFGNPRKEN